MVIKKKNEQKYSENLLKRDLWLMVDVVGC